MIRIIAVGRMKDRNLGQLAETYLQRARGMARLELKEIKDSRPDREDREITSLLGSDQGNQVVVALDERGEDLDSMDLARLLGAHGSVTFVIGGPDGLGPGTRERSDRFLRLSSLTLTHEMARVLLLEQVYRGLTILAGKPYHRA